PHAVGRLSGRDPSEALVVLAQRLLVGARDERDDGFVGEVRKRPGHRRIFAHGSEPVRRPRRISADMQVSTERSDRTMRKLAVVLLAVAASAALVTALASRGGSPSAAQASSHREAPLISEDPS